MSKKNKDGKPPAGSVTAGLEGNVVPGKKMVTNGHFISIPCGPQGSQKRTSVMLLGPCD